MMKTVRRSSFIRCIGATAAAIIVLMTIGATATESSQFEAAAAPAMADRRLLVASAKSANQGLWIINNLHFNNIAYISDIQGRWLQSSGIPVASVAFGALDFGPPGDVAFDKATELVPTGNLKPALATARTPLQRLSPNRE